MNCLLIIVIINYQLTNTEEGRRQPLQPSPGTPRVLEILSSPAADRRKFFATIRPSLYLAALGLRASLYLAEPRQRDSASLQLDKCQLPIAPAFGFRRGRGVSRLVSRNRGLGKRLVGPLRGPTEASYPNIRVACPVHVSLTTTLSSRSQHSAKRITCHYQLPTSSLTSMGLSDFDFFP